MNHIGEILQDVKILSIADCMSKLYASIIGTTGLEFISR